MDIISKIKTTIKSILFLLNKLEKIQTSLGRIEFRQLEQLNSSNFNDHEMHCAQGCKSETRSNFFWI